MTFEVAADAYGRFMGRFSEPLAAQLADAAEVEQGQRALDVGCGPGALTVVLVERLGAERVAAVDPSDAFVAACRSRLPEVDVRSATAEHLPFDDDTFDVCLANLVVHFMADPVAGLSEMARVTRPGGVVGATVWDHSGGTGPLSPFWRVVADLEHGHPGDPLGGPVRDELPQRFQDAGLHDLDQRLLQVRATFTSFDDWWEPMTFGIGPAGQYVAGLDPDHRERLRTRAEQLLPQAPFEVPGDAWTVLARVRPAAGCPVP